MQVYLDNSATTRQYDEVTEKMCEVMKETYGNPSSLHRKGLDAEKLVKEARKDVASLIGASAEEITFTSCGTESNNTVLFGVAEAKKRQGKRIITSKVEHPAILEPAKKLEAMGYDIKYLDVDRNCQVNLDQLREYINEETILISVMRVNNETGAIMPLDEIAKIRDEKNAKALLHTDAVQALGKVNCNVNGSACLGANETGLRGVDLMSGSAHKIHGPKGMGMLYVKKGASAGSGAAKSGIRPFILGGGQEKGFRSGTENVPGICGYGLAAKMAKDGMAKRIERMAEVRSYLLCGLKDGLDDILINSPEDGCASVLNVSFLGTRGEVILHTLEQAGIYVSTGSACSSNKNQKGSHVLDAMGLSFKEIEGAIRFSFSEFNTVEEMDYVLDKVVGAVKRFRKLGAFR